MQNKTLNNPAVLVSPRFKLPAPLQAVLVALLYAASSLGLILGLWLAVRAVVGSDLPTPWATAEVFWQLVRNPFFNNGPNDQGVGNLLAASLMRVGAGWFLGALVAIPLGILMGAIQPINRLMNPIVQLLRPVSPLAWYPIALVAIKSAPNALIFVIFITSLWPTVINTSFGVASVPRDYRNVAKVFNFSWDRYLRRVLFPFALPHIITGLRLSLGIAWMVIVAAEMLSGASGIGFFAWDSYNALSYEKVISAIVLIGVVGLLLDRVFDALAKKVSYAQ
jgi:nitrate/nitrite transport system permease protein